MVRAEVRAGDARGSVSRGPLLLAAAGSLVVVLVGLLWRGNAEAYPFGPGDDFADSSLLGAANAVLAGWLAIGVGAFGLATVAGLAYAGRRTTRVLLVAAVVQAVTLGLLVPDVQVLILAAYLLAFVVPPVLLAAKVRDGLRNPRARWPIVFVLSGLAALGVAGGVLRPDTFADFGRGIGDSFGDVGARPFYLLLALWVAACWAWVVVSYVRATGSGRVVARSRAWVARWGVAATWVAALSPLPYVVSRLTWLTPWPLLAGGIDLAENPAIRLMGILLGLVAECCLWLTLGLIRPRGEVFPRWIPYVGGRAVPVMAAVVPGLSGAVLLTIAGRSLVQQCLFAERGEAADRWLLLLMPLWLWGPALAVATLAYWLRRTAPTRPVHVRAAA